MSQRDQTSRRTTAADAERRWAAVIDRDVSGAFVYAVATTGVYCRPSCPSRRPRRENVSFHDTPAAARAAGFRACKRCRPDESAAPDRHATAIADACRRIEAEPDAVRLADLAAQAGLSPHHFHRRFKAATGVTPKAYAAAVRSRRMRDGLAANGAGVTATMFDAGYGSAGSFYAEAKKALGMKPSEYRSGGTGAVIRFAVGRCSLGEILVAATDKGVCAVLLGDTAQPLIDDLARRFPKATIEGGDTGFDKLAARVLAAVESGRPSAGLPLDIQGTAFQHRVWQALTGIPRGATATYAEIAARIGSPRAVRAVAAACAANPLAVIVPCHRVVRAGGGLAGYRWGIARKRRLLAREASE